MTEHVELWLRSVSSWTVGREGTFVDDLDALAAQDVIDDYEVTMWNDHVPLDAERDLTAKEATVRGRVETIESWAEAYDYDLPAFSRTKQIGTGPGFDGPTYVATVLPLAVLLGFEDGGLQWMAPYTDGDEHVSVQDRLDELAARPVDPESDREEQLVEAE
jgi:hypothetical protein